MTDNCIGQCQTMQRVLLDEEIIIPDAANKIIIRNIPAYICPSCSGREMAGKVRQELTEFKQLFLANAAFLAQSEENITVEFRLKLE